MSSGTDIMSDTTAIAGSGCQPVQSPPKVRSYHRWTPSEEQELLQAVEEHGRKSWDFLSQSSKYPLLSCRSATMLKNKFYKLLRAEQGTSAAADERKTDEQHLETTRNRVTSLELRMAAKKSESSASQDTPLKKAKRDLTAAAQEACHHQGSGAAGALLTSPMTTTTDASSHGGLAQMMSSAGITTTTAKVDDALAMLKEALAIQIDANKAVSMCIEARDSGRGDDDTVRAALHVASLAQEKAAQARRILTTARQEQAALMLHDETADGTVDVVNEFHFPQLDNGETKQAAAALGFDTASEQIFSSSHFTALNDFMSSTPSTKGSGRRTTPCMDSALLDACNFMVDHEWPHMNEASVDKLWNDIQQHSLEGLACCKHHADMFAAPGSLHGIDDLSMWDLANTCMPSDKNNACRWNGHDHEASHLHT